METALPLFYLSEIVALLIVSTINLIIVLISQKSYRTLRDYVSFTKIIDKNSFADVLSEQEVVFCGDANEKVSSVLSYQLKAEFVDVKASANYMALPAYQQFLKQDFVDVAYFEPFYLKSFQSAVSKVKGLK